MDTILTDTPHLADYIRPVWQRKWLVLFVVLLATGATYAYEQHHPKRYDAGTLVFYVAPGDPVTGIANQTTDRTVQDLAALLYSRDTALAVAKRISYPGSPGQLLANVTVAARTGEDFVAISGSASDPRLAAAIANGYAQELVSLTNSAQQQRITHALNITKQQLAQAGRAASDAGTRQALTGQLSRLQLELQVPGTNTRQVSPAVAPASPTSPKPVRAAIFAFVLSLLLAIAVTFALERFDRRLKRPEDLESGYGLPLLAVLPHSADPAPRRDGVVGLGPDFHDAFGLLRTNIQLLTLDAPPRSIVVVSAVPGEGKSTVVRNLAISLCEAGKRVAVVEADLRRPMQSGLFGLAAGPGLTEVLTGAAQLSDVLHQVPTRARGVDTLARIKAGTPTVTSPNGQSPNSADATISVLLAGTRPANAATVLESSRLREVLDQLGASHDVLVLDSAPLLSVTDSVPLVRYADAALIIGRLSLTTRDSVRRMIEFLGRMPSLRLLGVVANDLTQLGAGGYGYGHGYGYGYGYGYGSDAAMRSEPKRAKSPEHA